MTMSSGELIASYFRQAEKPLFGCFNGPRAGRARATGIVICQPIGHEYVNSHRALRQLAVRLAAVGFPVLRFDYFGCGDSSGEAVEGRTTQWIHDLGEAISEITRRSKVTNVCLVGLRLGASIALLGSQHSRISTLVLWDPVVKGRAYLESVISLNQQLLRFRPKPGKQRRPDWPKDIIGFPLPRELYDEIDQLDLLAVPTQSAARVLIVETETNPDCVALKSHLERSGGSVTLERLESPPIWVPTVNGGLHVPMNVLQSVADWVGRTCT
jgi:pimeloyl-ACP methyl ester carboxylesterase